MAAKTLPEIPAFKKCKVDEVIAYCEAAGEVDWLKKTNADCKSFFNLRKAFYEKFAPAMIPTKSKKTYKDRIAAL